MHKELYEQAQTTLSMRKDVYAQDTKPDWSDDTYQLDPLSLTTAHNVAAMEARALFEAAGALLRAGARGMAVVKLNECEFVLCKYPVAGESGLWRIGTRIG